MVEKCKHPNMQYGVGKENEKKGEYPVPRERTYTSEHCPDCPYGMVIYGPWLAE